MSVDCPLTQFESGTQDVESVRLDYLETNTGSDILDDFFRCQARMRTQNGTNYTGSTLYTCNTAGGCTSGNSTDNPGTGYLSWSNPFSSTSNLVYIGVWCSLCEASPGSCTINGFRVEVTGA